MSDDGYNGWRGGYCTWAVALWIDNDPATYDRSRELARVASSDEHPRATLADSLKEWIRDDVDLDEASLRADLLGYALDLVDWHEIAVAFLEDVVEAPA